jgi:hypothetical protein
MQCAAKVAASLTDSKDGTPAALCSKQMAGTIALTCVSDFQSHCDATASFEDLKDCSEDNQEDFSSACSQAIDDFKEDYKHAMKTLLKKNWKDGERHHHGHHKHRQTAEHSTARQNQEEVQWLWGGEIVSDPEAEKHHKWMKWAKWVGGALILFFVVFLVLCYRRRKARKLALAQAAGSAVPPQPAAAPATRWYHRFDVFGCRHPHRQLLAGNDHLSLQSTSRPSAVVVESAPVRYAVA